MTLDQYLAETKMTEKAFAQLVGLSQPHINRLRKGKGWPQREALERIRLHTGGKVTADDFLAPEASQDEGAAA